MAVLDTESYLNAVCRMLSTGAKQVPVPVQGTSMRPFLGNGDFVFLDAVDSPVKKGDIILFRRANGRYILHRVYKVKKQGIFLMLGDGQLVTEPIAREQMMGRVVRVTRRGKTEAPGSFVWWFFASPWRILAPWRKQISGIREWFRK